LTSNTSLISVHKTCNTNNTKTKSTSEQNKQRCQPSDDIICSRPSAQLLCTILQTSEVKLGTTVLQCVQKRIPDIIDCNFKKDDRILIVFGTRIPDTTGHQMNVQVPTSPKVCSCTTWGNGTHTILHFFIQSNMII